MGRRPRGLLLAFVLLVAPAGYIAGRALYDPRVPFLPPSFVGDWMVVEGPARFGTGDLSTTATYVREFSIPNPETSLELVLRAFGDAIVAVNGSEVPASVESRNWKHPARYDLRPYIHQGDNILRVTVQNAHLVTALLVEAPPALATPSGWIATRQASAEVAPTTGPYGFGLMPVSPGPLQEWSGWPWARWGVVAWLCVIIGATLAPIAARIQSSQPRVAPGRETGWLTTVLPVLVILVCASLNLVNAGRFPSQRTPFDVRAHKDYIERVAQTWWPPLASDGFEMYQPPLYYFTAAAVETVHAKVHGTFDFRSTQRLGCLSGIVLVVLAWLYVRQDAPHDRTGHCIGTMFAAFLPMSLYMNVLVTNEVFAAALIAGGFYLLLEWVPGQVLTLRRAAIAGVVNGAALLAKFTALFALASGVLVLGMQLIERRTRRMPFAILLGTSALVCGWYYLRNAAIFGHPFVGNWDQASGFRYEQVPGYRTLAFYAHFGGVFFHHPASAPGMSWLDALYGSTWGDPYGTFLRRTDSSAYFWSQVQLMLAAFPTLVVVLGFIGTVVAALRHSSDRDVLLAAMPLLTWAALLSFSMDVPAYSTVKAPFFLALVPCLAVFLTRGRRLLSMHFQPACVALDATVVLVSILSIAVYRYP